jgi:high-affinity iron transporter
MAAGRVMAFQSLNAVFVTSLTKHEYPMKMCRQNTSALEPKPLEVNNVLLLISN